MDTQNPDPNLPDVSPDESPLAGNRRKASFAAVTAERDRLAAEKAELQDRLRRARAEFENARRRAERERSDFLQFAAMDLVRRPAADPGRFRTRAQSGNRRQGIRQRRRTDLSAAARHAEEDRAGADRTAGQAIRPQPASGRASACRPKTPKTRRFWASSREAIISKASFSGPRW